MKVKVTEHSHWDESDELHIRVMEEGEYGYPDWLLELPEHEDVSRLFDHPRHIGNIAIGEPYDGRDFEFEALIAFCKRHDLHFHVTGKSHHYPGATFRVVLWRPEDDAKVDRVRYWTDRKEDAN